MLNPFKIPDEDAAWYQRGKNEGEYLRLDGSWETLPSDRYLKERAESIIRKSSVYSGMIGGEFKDAVRLWMKGCKKGFRSARMSNPSPAPHAYIRRVSNPGAMTNDAFYTWKSRLFDWGARIGLQDAKTQKESSDSELERQFQRVDGRVVPIDWGAFESAARDEFSRGYSAGLRTPIRFVTSWPTSNKKRAEETARMLQRQGFEDIKTKKEKGYPYEGASKQVTMYTVIALTDKRGALPYGIKEL